uniref:Secreted protein n=1 Tax=Arundo donax TaxID=35708 RepID=A0A0A9EU73_ARUDO
MKCVGLLYLFIPLRPSLIEECEGLSRDHRIHFEGHHLNCYCCCQQKVHHRSSSPPEFEWLDCCSPPGQQLHQRRP